MITLNDNAKSMLSKTIMIEDHIKSIKDLKSKRSSSKATNISSLNCTIDSIRTTDLFVDTDKAKIEL